MNNDISIRPAYLDQIGPEDAFAEIHGFVRPPRISMLNDRFNPLDENGDPALPPSLQLQVIMLQENDTRIYYPAGEYKPDDAVPPSCYSDNKITPSEGAQQPQHATCAGCPRSVRDLPSFNGTTLVSACKERYKVACLVGGTKGKVFLLDIGPASRKAYGAYFNFLKQHHAKANQVITTLAYADKAFSFSFEEWLNPATVEIVKEIYLTDEPAMVVNAFDRPREPALLPPKSEPRPVPTAPNSFLNDEHGRPLEVQTGINQQQVVEPPKRRGRPPKDTTPPTGELFGQAPAVSAVNPTPPQSAPAPKGNGFGMEEAKAPPQNILDALNRAGIGKTDAKLQADVNTAFGR